MLATITILSAISYSALANVVAYEAFTQGGIKTTVSLQSLYRSPSHTSRDDTGGGGFEFPSFNTIKQKADFTSQWFAILTSLGYSPANQYLENDAYIGTNMTTNSLARVPPDIIDLLSVPAYRLTYDCRPSIPNNPGLTILGSVNQALTVDVSAADPLNSTRLFLYNGYIENGASAILSLDNGQYQFVAFTQGLSSTSFYLGSIASFNTSNFTTITSFGPLKHVAFNNTLLPLPGQTDLSTKAVLSMWGIECLINRQTGTVDLHRDINTTWTRSPGTFSNDKDVLSLFLRVVQLRPSYTSPVDGTIPGLGGALAASSNVTNASIAEPVSDFFDYEDFATFADNYLYAEGEARRIVYDIAQEIPSPNPADEVALEYELQAQSSVLKYGRYKVLSLFVLSSFP